MSSTHHHLVNHFNTLREKELLCDFEFILPSNNSKIKAHSIILKQSEYFQNLSSCTIILDSKYDECTVSGALDCIYGKKVKEFSRVVPFLLEFEFVNVIIEQVSTINVDVISSPQSENPHILTCILINTFQKSNSSSVAMDQLLKIVIDTIRKQYNLQPYMDIRTVSCAHLIQNISKFTKDEFVDFFKHFVDDLHIGVISKLLLEWIKINPTERTKQAGEMLMNLHSLCPKPSNIPPPPLLKVPTCIEDPRLSTYFKLLNVGVPRGQIDLKMRMAGFDPSVLDTPNAMSPLGHYHPLNHRSVPPPPSISVPPPPPPVHMIPPPPPANTNMLNIISMLH